MGVGSAGNDQFEVIGIDAKTAPATLFDQVSVRHRADECAVTRGLGTDHAGAAVVLRLHNAAVATVRHLARPYPAAGIILRIRHSVQFLLFWRHS